MNARAPIGLDAAPADETMLSMNARAPIGLDAAPADETPLDAYSRVIARIADDVGPAVVRVDAARDGETAAWSASMSRRASGGRSLKTSMRYAIGNKTSGLPP